MIAFFIFFCTSSASVLYIFCLLKWPVKAQTCEPKLIFYQFMASWLLLVLSPEICESINISPFVVIATSVHMYAWKQSMRDDVSNPGVQVS